MILRNRGWAAMNGAELETLAGEAHDPQGEFLRQLEQFYVGASQTVREGILDQARSWGDHRWHSLPDIFSGVWP